MSSTGLLSVPPLFYVDRSDRGRLRLTGRDRQSFLQGMVTNDVARLTPGEGCYALLLDATGHVLADLRVLCLDNALLLDTEPGMASFVAETLERYLIMEKCRITDISDETIQILVGGFRAVSTLEALAVPGIADWAEGANGGLAAGHSEAFPARVAATRLASVPTFDVYLDCSDRESLVGALAAANASILSESLLESLRIEAGIPRFGFDMDSRVLAPETGQRNRAINYRKGCYIGQEIVARIDSRGHTNRALTGFVLMPDAVLPSAEVPVEAEGREVGRITSAAFSPTLGTPIALGYLRHEFLTPGTAVTIAGSAATVAALPFVATTGDGADGDGSPGAPETAETAVAA
ncbi:MAG: folate-binding protein YgfZ [Cytophagales bacterium]|nr:folate-binding protein YgfZ [Armatimonadota bacterium]